MKKHISIILCAAPANTNEPPEVFLMNRQWLALARTEISNGNHELSTALASLVNEAEAALDDGPFTVTNKTRLPPSGDKHDYMSVGPYWWPNPETKDGLPYIRRDGQTNPEREADTSDSKSMGQMVRATDTLALAYYFTGHERYAARATLLLRTWFLDKDTRMNPHLRYAQAIPGRVSGRGIGIIDTVSLTKVVDAAGLLESSAAWTQEDHAALKKWFAAYIEWLRNSQHGVDERNASNNHGTWYDVQVACFALFVGDRALATETLQSACKDRISQQIRPDGKQPHELARTKSFDYTIYNLTAMFKLARLSEHVNVDLWHFRGRDGASIQAALNYIAPYADRENKWPHEQIGELRPAKLLPLLRQGFLIYSNPVYLELIRGFSDTEKRNDRSQLLYPILSTQQPPARDK